VLRREFVERKLQLITDDLGQLARFRTDSYEFLVADPVRLAAVERILERVVLRSIDVNEHVISTLATGEEQRTTRLSYRDTFLKLADYGVYPADFAQQIAPSAGLRNILSTSTTISIIASCTERFSECSSSSPSTSSTSGGSSAKAAELPVTVTRVAPGNRLRVAGKDSQFQPEPRPDFHHGERLTLDTTSEARAERGRRFLEELVLRRRRVARCRARARVD